MRASHDQRLNGQSAAARLPQSPNLNALWASLIVEELVRCGVTLFCVAPGSRSAPLAIAAAEHPRADVVVHFDERGSAFVALGWARATGKPACWVTTSGTAVANGLPAIVEADADDVPLIALTADRPPELRDTGANQTIRQTQLFATVARWTVDLPPPSIDVSPEYVLTTVDQAVHRSMWPGGPVHLNVMLREPLAPTPDERPLPDLPQNWLAGESSYTTYSPAPTQSSADALSAIAGAIDRSSRGLIIAGRMTTEDEARAVVRLSEHLGWPLMADVCSGVGMAGGKETLCTHGDLILADAQFGMTHRPDCVLRFGAPGVSKRVATLISESEQATNVVVHASSRRLDPDHNVTHRVQGDIASAAEGLVTLTRSREAGGWLSAWRTASAAVEEVLVDWSNHQQAMSEPLVARILVSRDSRPLVVGSSMPIRDVDSFAAHAGLTQRVFANRGASGIDGTIATAAGIARGLGAPVTVLLGDLALLHDLNSLALLRAADQPPVTIVVINNDGGGIFHFLPVVGTTEHFETVLGTPHGLSFELAADQFGVQYVSATTPSELEAAISGGGSLIEVTTDRVANVDLHRDLVAACAAAVSESGVVER